MKKFLALAIAAIMLLSVVPFTAFAENGATAESESSVCYIDGETKVYYDSVIAAEKAIPTGGTATIVLIKDTVEASWVQPTGKNITIDGQGHTLSRASGYVFDINKGADSADYSFTLKNTTIVGDRGLWFNTNEINIINCVFNLSTELGISAAPAAAAVVNIVDTTWNQQGICFARTGNNNSADITFNIENSTISVTPGYNASPLAGNNCVFNVFQKTTLTVNVDETSKIVGNGNSCGGIFCLNSDVGGFNLSLANGAVLELNDAVSGAMFIVEPLSADKMNIVDNGAIWKAPVSSVNKGVTLPAIVDDNGSWVWAANGVDMVDNIYFNPTAIEDVVFTHKIGTPDTSPAVKVVDANDQTLATYATVRDAFSAMFKGEVEGAVKAVVLKGHVIPGAMSAGVYNPDGAYTFELEGVTREDGTEPLIIAKAGLTDTLALWNLNMTNINASNLHANYHMFMYDTYYSGGWKDVANGGNLNISDCNLFNHAGNMFKLRGGASTEVAHAPFNITIESSNLYSYRAGKFLDVSYQANVNFSATDSYICKQGSGRFMCIDLNTKLSDVDFVADNTVIEVNTDSPFEVMNEKSSCKLSVSFVNGAELDFDSTVGNMWYAYAFANEPGAAGEFDLYVDETSAVDVNLPASGTRGGVVTAMSGKHNVTLEKGATIGLNGKAADMWILQGSASLYTIDDQGATYVIGETVESAADAKGVILPNCTPVEGETFVGYAMDGDIYKGGILAKTAGTYAPVIYGADEFCMVDGASLRTVYLENGIRFSSNVSGDLYDALGDNAVYGTIIAPGTANPNAFEGEKLNIVHENTYFDEDNNQLINHAAVIKPEGVSEKAMYELVLAANAYFTVTYADGTTATFNTAFGAENVRSMKQVAENLSAQGYTNRVVAHILEVCA